MSELKLSVHDETNGLDYILAGDYYIPAIKLLRTMTAPSKNGGGCTGQSEGDKSTVQQMMEAEGIT